MFHAGAADINQGHQNKIKNNNRKMKNKKTVLEQLKGLKSPPRVTKYKTNLEIKTDEFIRSTFPTSYAEMDLFYEEDPRLEKKLNHIENMVNQAANTKSVFLLNDALALLKDEPSLKGVSSPRILVQFADALSLSYHLNSFDVNIIVHAVDTYIKVLTSYTDSETMYKIAGKRCVHVLWGLKRHSDAIAIQKKLLLKFPNTASQNLNILGSIYLDMGNSTEAKNAFNRSLQLNPDTNGFAKMTLGFLLYCEAKEKFIVKEGPALIIGSWQHLVDPCIGMMQTGIHTMQQAGERIDPMIRNALGDALKNVRLFRQSVKSEELYEKGAREHKYNSFWQRTDFYAKDVISKPFWEPNETKIGYLLIRISKNWKAIRREALEALKSNLYIKHAEGLRENGDWKYFPLYMAGKRNDQNCMYAPVTCNFIQDIPEISKNLQGAVKFSLMSSGTHVLSHSGPSNCRLRAHLGIDVPKHDANISTAAASSSRLRVLNEYRYWNDGEIFIFDDSFDHEVWHFDLQNRTRLILILDMWHPYLTEAKSSKCRSLRISQQ